MEADPNLDRFESRRSTVYARNGIVATSQPLAATAGLSMLQSGGNAFDAAVATAAALNVVEPTNTGLGGDVFALYRTADGEIGGLQSCGGAPADATIESVREAVATQQDCEPESVSMPETGPHTVTVPGTARGWEATIENFGRKTLSEALDPAIEYATEGYPVTEVVAEEWRHGDDLFTDNHAREAYLPAGRPPRVGEIVRLPELGKSLQAIAERGADALYEGGIGKAIVEEVQSRGGFLSMNDLSSFEPSFVDPISTTYRGTKVYELPPNNQGLIVLEALNIATELNVETYPHGSPERIHALAEALKLAFHDGHKYISDPEYENIPDLNSRAYATRRAKSVTDEAASDVSFGIPDSNAENSDTVLLTVADKEGNIVSYINSRFEGFGSGLVAGNTGIALQNRGASFSLDPAHPNRLEPNKRPFHTLIPALAKFGENDWAAFGLMGGYMQPQGHVQILSNLIDSGKPLQEALDEPRWRYMESGELAVESRMDATVITKLVRKGHDVTVLTPELFGGAQIVRNNGGALSGATEPRKDGSVVGF